MISVAVGITVVQVKGLICYGISCCRYGSNTGKGVCYGISCCGYSSGTGKGVIFYGMSCCGIAVIQVRRWLAAKS